MALTPTENLDKQLKYNLKVFVEMSANFLTGEKEASHPSIIFKAGYTVVLKQSQKRDTLADLAVFKALLELTMESLDDDETTIVGTDKKMNEGQKLNLYDFLGTGHEYYEGLVQVATLIALVEKCGNNKKKIRKHFDAYTEQVKSKLEKMVEKTKKKIVGAEERVE